MASEMARNNGESDEGVYFPFSRTEEELPGMIARRKFDRCGKDAITLLKKLKPFKGGNLELRELHDLDIRDKHTSLIPRAHIKVSFNPSRVISGEVEKSNSRVIFVFPTDSPLGGREIVSTSKHLVSICEEILNAFANIE